MNNTADKRDTGILFSGPMVRAILDGRKTQTRRIVKPQPSERTEHWWFCVDSTKRKEIGLWTPKTKGTIGAKTTGERIRCPYGQVGDRLWVRERHWYRATDGITTYADGSFRTHPSAIIGSKYVHESDVINWPEDAKRFGFKCVPSIHMPRWASRITLEITGVRVERLNDISEQDAIAEGIEWQPRGHGNGVDWKYYGWLEKLDQWSSSPIYSYQSHWESINGDGSWAANPWVWVIEFKRV